MATPPLVYPRFKAPDAPAGTVDVYEAGSLQNRKTTYSLPNLTSANTNPVVLDSLGEADIFYSGLARIIVKDESGAQILDKDNIGQTGDTTSQYNNSLTATYASSTSFTLSGDQTTEYHVNRIVRLSGSSTAYGYITASSYSSPNTTVTVVLTSGTLDATLANTATSIIAGDSTSGIHSPEVLIGRTSIFPKAHISGLVPSSIATVASITFSAGDASDSAGEYDIIAGAMTKTTTATWSAGNNNGGVAEGVTFGTGTWHIFLLGKTTSKTAHDFIIDSSKSAVNALADSAVVAAGFDIVRRVFSVDVESGPEVFPTIDARELAGGGIEVLRIPLHQTGKDWSGADDTAQTLTFDYLPNSVTTTAIFSAWFLDTSFAANSAILFTSTDQADTAANVTFGSFVGDMVLTTGASGASGRFEIPAVNGAIRYRTIGSTVDHSLDVCLHGWIDERTN